MTSRSISLIFTRSGRTRKNGGARSQGHKRKIERCWVLVWNFTVGELKDPQNEVGHDLESCDPRGIASLRQTKTNIDGRKQQSLNSSEVNIESKASRLNFNLLYNASCFLISTED